MQKYKQNLLDLTEMSIKRLVVYLCNYKKVRRIGREGRMGRDNQGGGRG